VKGVETLIVFDRCISFGGPGGPVSSEIRSTLYGEEERPKVVSFIGGLGGRDMSAKAFEYVIDRGREVSAKGSKGLYETVGIRGKVPGIRG
jgi:pyruvate ferredoxin oxidoreductase alpha subunit